MIKKMVVALPDGWRAIYVHTGRLGDITKPGGVAVLKSPEGTEARREEWPGKVTHRALEHWGRNALMAVRFERGEYGDV